MPNCRCCKNGRKSFWSPGSRKKNKYKTVDGGNTFFRAYDVIIKKESALSSISGNAPTNRSVNRPVLNTDSFGVSIRDLLKHVNDNLNLPYINTDGTPNYGINFGDHEPGGVMFITPKDNTTFDQCAWHGSGMAFNLGKPLTGAGDMVHSRGIYTVKNKKTVQVYKKHPKSKGLPSYLHEVDIPEDENLLDEEKYYEHRPQQ